MNTALNAIKARPKIFFPERQIPDFQKMLETAPSFRYNKGRKG